MLGLEKQDGWENSRGYLLMKGVVTMACYGTGLSIEQHYYAALILTQ